MSDIERIKTEIERLRCESGPEHFDFYELLDHFKEFIDSMPEDDLPKTKGWVARNKDESLVFCYHRPHRENSITLEWWGSCDADFRIYDDTIDEQFKDLKWEDEPRKVELFINPIDEPKEMSVDEAMARLDEKIARASKSWEGIDIDKFLDDLRGRETDDLEKSASRLGFDYVDNIVHESPEHRWNDHDVEFGYRDGFIAGAKWMNNQMPMPEDTVIFMKGVEEGRRLEREEMEGNKKKENELPRFYGD